MSQNRLPPLQLGSPRSVEDSSNNEESNASMSQSSSARERRHRRIIEKQQQQQQSEGLNSSRRESSSNEAPRRTRRSRSAPKENNDSGHDNSGFVNEKEEVDAEKKRTSVTRTRRSDEQLVNSKPPQARRKNKKSNINPSGMNILQGLEEDVVEMQDEYFVGGVAGDETKNKDNSGIENSRTELINDNNNNINMSDNFLKSAPTENFYLELEKKFARQKKEIYEKKEQERLRQQFDAQLKQKQKEDLKYQISTPHTALSTHKFLRTLFLFIHGLNVGFQFWHVIVVYFLDIAKFSPTQVDSQIQPLMILFDQLAMPIHCLSYFFLTICIIDSIDRVDFTKMSCDYFVKCISFQNQFWSIICYMVALIFSLSLIYIDQAVFIVSNQAIINVQTNLTALNNISRIGQNVQIWQSFSIVRAVLSLLAWLIFTVFIKHDKTYESLEKRDFNLLDDIINEKAESPLHTIKQQKHPSILSNITSSNLSYKKQSIDA